MKEGRFGMMTEAPGGASDPDLAEIRMTPIDYEELLNKIRKAEREVSEARETVENVKKRADKKISGVIESVNIQIEQFRRDAEQEAMKRVSAAEKREQETLQRFTQISEELKAQTYLNENLKRIARERANAARGITPKKSHDGYLVLSSRQWVEHYNRELTEEEYNAKPDEFKARHKFPYREHLTADVWKSILQTPYDASLPLEQISSSIDEDLWDKGVLEDIGGEVMNPIESNGVYSDFGGSNGLYKWNFVANYKSGLWEIEIYTTKSLCVPEHRRPVICGRKIQKNT